MHYCQGSLGWYEHLRNTLTVIVQEVEADRDDRPKATTRIGLGSRSSGSSGGGSSGGGRGDGGGTAGVRACHAAVAALDATVASGILTLVLAMLGYTSPVTALILVGCCARWHHRRLRRSS